MTNSINSVNKVFRLSFFCVFGFVIIVYGIFRIIPIVQGVNIQTNPILSSISENNIITIKGTAKNAKILSVNGREILIEKNGSFIDDVVLSDGINKITLVAEDIRGKIHTKEIIMTGKKVTYNKNEIIEVAQKNIDTPITSISKNN